MKFICALLLTLLCIQTVNAGDSQINQDIGRIEWNHDGSKIAVGYSNGTFRIFRSNDMTILFEQLTTDTAISSLAWSPSDTKLAIGYYLDRVDIWDVVRFQKKLSLFTGSSQNNRLMWGEDDDTLFVSDGADIPTVEFDANTGIVLETYTVIYSNIRLLHIRDISVNHWRSRLFFVDLNNMTVIDEFNFDSQLGRIVSVQVSPDEDLIAIGFVENIIHILDIQSREIIAVLDGGQETEGQFGISDLAFNETGSRLFTASQSGTIRSWDTATWQMIDNVELNSLGLTFIADFSPNARQFAYADWEQGSQFFIRDLCDFVAPDGASLENILPQANNFNEEAQICLIENGQYDLTAPLPTITGDITIIGNGARITMIGEGQIFIVEESGNLTLKDVTLSGGDGMQGNLIDGVTVYEANSSR